VPLIVGFGAACELCRQEMAAEAERLTRLRERLTQGIRANLESVSLNGHPTLRLPGNVNLTFDHVEGGALLIGLQNIAVSSGSACTSALPEPSHVLQALGLSEERAHGSLRFGLGRFTTAEEIEVTISEVVRVVRRLRSLSPGHAMAQAGIG
jgi:cysteine desulfurase